MANSLNIILDNLLDATPSSDPGWAMEIWNRINNGHPVSILAPLIVSDNDYAAEQATWLLSEIGSRGRELLKYAEHLIFHRSYRVRYWVVDFLLLACTEDDPEIVNLGFNLFLDNDTRVSAMAIHQFARYPDSVLFCAMRDRLNSPSQWPPSIFIQNMLHFDSEWVANNISSSDMGTRSFAYATIVRNLPLSKDLFERAVAMGDPVMADIADRRRAIEAARLG